MILNSPRSKIREYLKIKIVNENFRRKQTEKKTTKNSELI